MRVKINQTEQRAGNQNNYFIRCDVQFTEEEKAIIRQRALYSHVVMSVYPEADVKQNPIVELGFVQSASRFLAIAGLPILFFSETYGLLCWVAAAALFVYRRKYTHKVKKSVARVDVTIQMLLNKGFFIGFAGTTPPDAKGLDLLIRDNLNNLKELIKDSQHIDSSSTFDL